MDIKFLEEYEKQEIEINREYKTITDRLGELKEPIYNLFCPTTSLWSQIVFSGTIIFPIRPVPKEVFESNLNMPIKKIPELIDFAKETHKIQFLLCDYPTQYLGYDYLEPFFKDSTPVYSLQKDLQSDELDDLYMKSLDELDMLFHLSPFWEQLFTKPGGDHIFLDYVRQYTMARHLGFNEISEVFIDNILVDPNFATQYLETTYDLFIHPTIDPFNANVSIPLDIIQKATQMGLDVQAQPREQYFPEVGSFLLKKIVYYPESLEACKQVMGRYKDNDLYNVYSALNTAIYDRNYDSALKYKENLELILDNTWKETQTIQSNSQTYKCGIQIACGIAGAFLSQSCGLLENLGLIVPTVLGSQVLDPLTESISKKVVSPYLVTIYDFQKKYRV